jgi:hypothetical protein
MLLVPVIFAVYFALIPQKEAAVCVFIAATGSSVLLFLVNLDNLPAIIMSAMGALFGGWFGMSVLTSLHRLDMEEELTKMSIGVIVGYLFIKLLEWIVGVWVKYMDYGKQTTESKSSQQ